jgi:hypothetical protein
MQNIQDIIEQIQNLEKRLSIEIQKKEKEFFTGLRGKRFSLKKIPKSTTKLL